jgi:RNA-directed DNA polymerase
MKDRQSNEHPPPVSVETKPGGDIQDRWSWVESSVWTDRMLTALETGVKGGKWYSLMDKIYSIRNLRSAFASVKANRGAAGVDRVTIKQFEEALEGNLGRLAQALQNGSYRPQPIKRVWIPKPGTKEKRPLGIPTVRDRVVQAAVRQVLEPVFERDFAEHSYGFRPGRSCKDALRQVAALLHQGYTWVVDADLKSYFDTIPHDQLLVRVAEKVSDNSILCLVAAFLQQAVLDTAKGWTPELGTPQGAVLSPLLSNIYLDPLDHLMADSGLAMVRYADDFVLLCRSAAEAQSALELVRHWTASVGLILHPDKTHIVDATQRGGFDFLGYHFERGYRWPRQKSVQKLKTTLRQHTRRCNGKSLLAILADVNRTLVGWFAYFQHSHRTTFPRLDSWLRMRLRSILRKRRGGRGRGRGADHQRWPNSFFAKHGLFSLVAAHAEASQSSRR